MRRKVLVILLTLSLVLSIMPMITFADTETEGSEPVNEAVEAEKAEPEDQVQDNEETEEAEVPAVETAEEEPEEDTAEPANEAAVEGSAEEASQKTVKGEALNALTGVTAPEACPHENLDTYYSWYDKDVKYTDIEGDDDSHKVTGKGEEVGFCVDCGIELWREETVIDLLDGHDYDGAVCRDCGHRKTSEEDPGRIYGKARYDTAIKVAEKYKSSSGEFNNVIVAYGKNFPDALSGGYLAKVRNAPILLVEPSEENRIVDYICNNIASNGTVYILGGTGVVSSAFENKVKARGITTKRLGGKDRYETNMNILKEAGVKIEDILVCTGNGYADSLSASAAGKPILLVGNALTDSQKSYIKGLSTKQFYLIGGTGAVKPAIEKGLKELGLKTERLAGSTRYETSTAVAKKFFVKAATVVLAYAKNFPDGLSGGPLAMMKSAPIVLTDSKTTAAARAYVKSAGVVESITLGGPALISDAAVKAIMGR